MLDLLVSILAALRSLFESEGDQALEVLALRQQLARLRARLEASEAPGS